MIRVVASAVVSIIVTVTVVIKTGIDILSVIACYCNCCDLQQILSSPLDSGSSRTLLNQLHSGS